MNTKVKTKTYAEALNKFTENHAKSKREYAIEVDDDGFVYSYNKGQKHSVSSPHEKNKMIIHNHPSGGNFSGVDLINTARTDAKGIVAVGSKGATFSFKKGTHFKGEKFIKAIKTANLKGLDYTHAVDNWLIANQKKYGYKYSRTGYTSPSKSKGKKK